MRLLADLIKDLLVELIYFGLHVEQKWVLPKVYLDFVFKTAHAKSWKDFIVALVLAAEDLLAVQSKEDFARERLVANADHSAHNLVSGSVLLFDVVVHDGAVTANPHTVFASNNSQIGVVIFCQSDTELGDFFVQDLDYFHFEILEQTRF
jgi:hypothetical protein